MPLLENIKSHFKKKEFKGLALDAYLVSEKSAERTLADFKEVKYLLLEVSVRIDNLLRIV